MKDFNDFCTIYLDRMYDDRFSFEEQGSGYKQLHFMVKNNITPATKEETESWENNPTPQELTSIPDVKYMRSLHPLVREVVRDNWKFIKTLKL